MNRAVELLREEESRLKQELTDIRAAIAKIEGTRTGRPKPQREFSGVSDAAAREVADAIRAHNGEGVPIGILVDEVGKSGTYVREGARKAVDIFPDIIRYKNADNGKTFYYKAKQATVADSSNGDSD